MAKKDSNKTGNLIGSFAFLFGVILALVAGFVDLAPWMGVTLVIVGLIIGLLNITANEAMGFMLAGTVLVVVTSMSADTKVFEFMGTTLPNIMQALMIVFVPATIIVALRAVFGLAKN